MLENLSQKIAQWEDENRKQRSQISQMYDQLFNVIDAKILQDRQTNDTISTLQSIAKENGTAFEPVKDASGKLMGAEYQKLKYTGTADIKAKRNAMTAEMEQNGVVIPEDVKNAPISQFTAFYNKQSENIKYYADAVKVNPDLAKSNWERVRKGEITPAEAYGHTVYSEKRAQEQRDLNEYITKLKMASLYAKDNKIDGYTLAQHNAIENGITKNKNIIESADNKLISLMNQGFSVHQDGTIKYVKGKDTYRIKNGVITKNGKPKDANDKVVSKIYSEMTKNRKDWTNALNEKRSAGQTLEQLKTQIPGYGNPQEEQRTLSEEDTKRKNMYLDMGN